jgi:diadenosine tetraphosphate (Ap4A) HIT family hydrolase
LFDLDSGDRTTLLGELDGVGRALESLFNPEKFNIAALGNVVPQLHVHVIARYSTDAAWPQPVWGRGEREPYQVDVLARRLADLRGALGALLG